MKLIQKIASHGLLIVITAAAIYIFMNRADLFPQWFAKSQPSVVNAATGQRPDAEAGTPAQQVTQSLPEKSGHGQEDSTVTSTAATGESSGEDNGTPPVTRPEVRTPSGDATAPTVETPDATSESTHTDAVTTWQSRAPDDTAATTYRPLSEDTAVDTPQAEQEPPITSALDNTAPRTDSTVTESEPADAAGTDATAEPGVPDNVQLEQRLIAVRMLYWQRDVEGAAAGYQTLARSYPENAEVWGEIGNFYYSLRQAQPAATAYSRAIELLAQQGDRPRALRLLNVVYWLDAAAARELQMRLQQAGEL